MKWEKCLWYSWWFIVAEWSDDGWLVMVSISDQTRRLCCPLMVKRCPAFTEVSNVTSRQSPAVSPYKYMNKFCCWFVIVTVVIKIMQRRIIPTDSKAFTCPAFLCCAHFHLQASKVSVQWVSTDWCKLSIVFLFSPLIHVLLHLRPNRRSWRSWIRSWGSVTCSSLFNRQVSCRHTPTHAQSFRSNWSS